MELLLPPGFLDFSSRSPSSLLSFKISRANTGYQSIPSHSATKSWLTCKPENGCYIHGLHLDGGRWNAGHQCLADPQPKVISFTLSSPAVFAFHPCCSCYSSPCLPHSCCPSPRKQAAACRLKAVALVALVLFLTRATASPRAAALCLLMSRAFKV